MKKEDTKRSMATHLRREHSQWRDTNFSNKVGFFPVFYEFKEILPQLSGGAVSLFIYIGLHSNNQTGECYHSIEKISDFFGKSPRTISKWIDELVEFRLIKRFQLEVNGPAHTFIRPYSNKEK
ncbi:helix-turn-helix domain-containing protein [Cytobacillus oceanisediminis]|uniref:helix-turn-helix domain-containing protein n=1 Tax=Cytobacillus oceanisediminis TaxID=665099 RepID=UPI00119FA761|nr:helix-turn-helix domain-containing protein [Cytobacillus oceanisediminis]